MLAETDAKNRSEHLEQLTAAVVKAMDLAVQRRVSNVLIHLDKYDELVTLCNRILELETEPKSPLRAQAYRDLAVALSHMRKFSEAEENFEKALSITPEDENLLKAYIALLRDTKQRKRAMELGKKLVTLDPIDWHYHVILAGMYVETGDYDIAIRWYDRAEPFVASEVERQALRREKQKASFLKEL